MGWQRRAQARELQGRERRKARRESGKERTAHDGMPLARDEIADAVVDAAAEESDDAAVVATTKRAREEYNESCISLMLSKVRIDVMLSVR